MNINESQTPDEMPNDARNEVAEASWDLSENLQVINTLLQQECTSLGVAVPACIQEDQVHLLSTYEYEKKWAEFPKSVGIAYLDDRHLIDVKDERDDFNFLHSAIIGNAESALERLSSGSEDPDTSDDALSEEAWDEAEELHGTCPEGSEDEFFAEYVDHILEEKHKDRDGYYEMVIEETPKKLIVYTGKYNEEFFFTKHCMLHHIRINNSPTPCVKHG